MWFTFCLKLYDNCMTYALSATTVAANLVIPSFKKREIFIIRVPKQNENVSLCNKWLLILHSLTFLILEIECISNDLLNLHWHPTCSTMTYNPFKHRWSHQTMTIWFCGMAKLQTTGSHISSRDHLLEIFRRDFQTLYSYDFVVYSLTKAAFQFIFISLQKHTSMQVRCD